MSQNTFVCNNFITYVVYLVILRPKLVCYDFQAFENEV